MFHKAATKKILVIEDDDSVRRVMERILGQAGYEVHTASEGAQGIALVRSLRPDLVITDIVMAGREGIETIRAIRKEFVTLPIIAVSGGGESGSNDYLTLARRFGANETLKKPFAPSELVGAVAQFLHVEGPDGKSP